MTWRIRYMLWSLFLFALCAVWFFGAGAIFTMDHPPKIISDIGLLMFISVPLIPIVLGVACFLALKGMVGNDKPDSN